jgi:hypothetical protein
MRFKDAYRTLIESVRISDCRSKKKHRMPKRSVDVAPEARSDEIGDWAHESNRRTVQHTWRSKHIDDNEQTSGDPDWDSFEIFLKNNAGN